MKFFSNAYDLLLKPMDSIHEQMDRPANISANRTFEEEVHHQYQKARNATSHSGVVCQLTGLLMVAVSPFALLMGYTGIPVAVASFAGGAATASLGSNANSNKRTAQLTEFNAWLKTTHY